MSGKRGESNLGDLLEHRALQRGEKGLADGIPIVLTKEQSPVARFCRFGQHEGRLKVESDINLKKPETNQHPRTRRRSKMNPSISQKTNSARSSLRRIISAAFGTWSRFETSPPEGGRSQSQSEMQKPWRSAWTEKVSYRRRRRNVEISARMEASSDPKVCQNIIRTI